MTKDEWETIGYCLVNAGCIVLLDPSYAIQTDGKWYQEQVIDRCYEGNSGCHGVKVEEGAHAMEGVLVTTGTGDGLYPVEVRYEEAGPPFGRVVSEVRVQFLTGRRAINKD